MEPTKLKFFQLHNPFYLLSALCMLAGCYGLVHSLRMAPGHSWVLLLLMGVLQIYEFLLVGLAWYLITHRRAQRDGRMLLLLELVFLVDATYLNTELNAAYPHVGALVSLVTLILVFIKVGVMLHALGVPFTLKSQAFVLTQFATLVFIPLIAARMSQQNLLSTGFFYAMWWLVGLLSVFQVWMVDSFKRRPLPKNWLRPLERNYRIGFVGLPVVSVWWHAGSLHWLYDVPFYGSYLTPLVLGLGVGLSLMGERHFPRARCLRLRWSTPPIALFFSLSYPNELLFSMSAAPLSGVVFSPFRVALLASAIVYFLSFWSYRWRPFLSAAVATSVLGVAGHSISSILDAFNRLLPKTAVEWFMASIVVAFVFLILGAAVSLSQRNDSRPPPRGGGPRARSSPAPGGSFIPRPESSGL